MIFGVIAVVVLNVPFAIQRQNLCRDAVQEKPIMTYRHDSSLVSIERIFQRFARWNIKMVGWFIKHQHVNARINQLRQGESSLLSAGEIADVLVNVIAGEKKLRKKRTQLARCRTRGRDASQLHNDLISLVEVFKLLRVITNSNFTSPTNLAVQRGNFAENRFQKSSLARSIRTDHAQTFSATQDQRNVARQNLIAVTDRHFVHGQDVAAGALNPLQTKIARGLIDAHGLNTIEPLEHCAA